jgi:hypothetical protein
MLFVNVEKRVEKKLELPYLHTYKTKFKEELPICDPKQHQ